MDHLIRFLEGTRAREAFALRAVMQTPWSVSVEAESPLTLLAGVQGRFWIKCDEAPAVEIGPGDIAIARPCVNFIIADSVTTTPTVQVFRGQDCRDTTGHSVTVQMTHGVRTWGNDPKGGTVFVVGAYEQHSEVSEQLRRNLPPLMVIRRDEWTSPLVGLLCDEVSKDEPGQPAVLDRLIDLLLASALKAWSAREEGRRPDWLRMHNDPLVERALRLLYSDPAHGWTTHELAERANTSRAAMSRRFKDIVGVPPMTFLTQYRMAMASDLLHRSGETMAGIANKVGYENTFAFSVAFKRVRGVGPQAYRKNIRVEIVDAERDKFR